MLFFINKFINHTLQLDPRSTKKLHELQGKRLRIHVSDVNLTVDCFFYEHEILLKWVSKNAQQENDPSQKNQEEAPLPDCVIQGKTSQFLQFLYGKNPLATQGLDISGDVTVAHQFLKLFTSLDIDWEEILSKYTGDIIANRVGQTIRQVKSESSRAMNSMSRNISEFLQEEKRILPTRFEVNQFLETVDVLHLDIERLQAKVSWLEQRLQQRKNNNG